MTDGISVPGATEETRWEGYGAGELAELWHLPRVDLHRVVGSTNDVARELAIAGAPKNALVIAEEQRAGRGRAGRQWSSPPGVGLWFSLVLRDLTRDLLETLPLRIALEVASVLDDWSTSPILVKWPNDLLVGGRKLGGILCESTWEGTRPRFVIAGLGLNLLQTPHDFPRDVQSTATSLRSVATREISRYEVAGAVIERLRRLQDGSAVAPPGELPRQFAARDALHGRAVEAVEPETGRRLARGIGAGIDRGGALLIDNGGSLTPIRSATIRILTD